VVAKTVWLGLGVVGLLAGAGGSYVLKQRALVAQRVADAKAWTVAGPPCGELTREVFLQPGQKGAQKFEFEGVQFFRRFGNVECAAIRDRGGRGETLHAVCRFTRPGDLMVRTGGAEFYFRPGPGRPAVVSTATGVPTCVLADAAPVGSAS